MTAAQLLARAAPLWNEMTAHPFIRKTADGSLPGEVFDRWLLADHCYVVGFRRFLADLVAIAPDEPARDLLAGGLVPLGQELALFRQELQSRGLPESAEPGPIALGYTSFIQAAPRDGFAVAVAVLFGAEKAYYDAWSAVRASADSASPYWPFVENWSSPAFGAWVDGIAELLDRLTPDGPTPGQRLAFERVARFELRFWNAVYRGDAW